MEGKAFLMKYLGGVDAVHYVSTVKDANVKMILTVSFNCGQHSFGAVNLEDISQPNCYKVLDVLREECDIPVCMTMLRELLVSHWQV